VISLARRIAVGVVGLLVAGFLGTALWEYLANLQAQHGAERPLQEVRALKMDESTSDSVKRIVDQFGATKMPFPKSFRAKRLYDVDAGGACRREQRSDYRRA
jgi:hypothetical protein